MKRTFLKIFLIFFFWGIIFVLGKAFAFNPPPASHIWLLDKHLISNRTGREVIIEVDWSELGKVRKVQLSTYLGDLSI